MPYIIDAITAETVNVNQELLVNGNPVLNYKKYVALLNQSGTDAPVATVLENTLGFDLTFFRDNVGEYYATPGFDDISKVYINMFANYSVSGDGNISRVSGEIISDYGNEFWFVTINASSDQKSDDWGSYIPLEIRVYN